MPMNIDGLNELMGDINRMANKLNTDSTGAATGRQILEAAAAPIHEQMVANASVDPKIISGDLHDAIKIGDVKKRRQTGLQVTIGVHRRDWNNEDYYPAYVEFGHAGPAPAPPHPYIRPAYDTRQDEAFDIIRNGLLDEITKT